MAEIARPLAKFSRILSRRFSLRARAKSMQTLVSSIYMGSGGTPAGVTITPIIILLIGVPTSTPHNAGLAVALDPPTHLHDIAFPQPQKPALLFRSKPTITPTQSTK